MTRTVCGVCGWDKCRCCRREATYLPALSERRERIATAAMQGLMADRSRDDTTYSCLAKIAVKAADALIAELDKEPKPCAALRREETK